MAYRFATQYFALTALFSLAFIVIHVINNEMHGALNSYGITPRQFSSATHILSAPFIHGNWQHLLNNLLGFFIFSTLCLTKSWRFYLLTSFFVVAVGGLLVWVFARSATHIGASGWVFGLWAASIAHAFFCRNAQSIVVAAVVVVFYGGMVFGVLPSQDQISYEGHLYGMVAGVLAAWFFKDS